MRIPLPNDVRARVWDRSEGKCGYCKVTLHPFLNFHVDHIFPVAAGGGNEDENLIASCVSCNLSMGSKGYRSALPPNVTTPVDIFGDIGEPLIAHQVNEVAIDRSVHPETVRRWIRTGLPAMNVGSKARPDYRIKPDVLEKWLADRAEIETEVPS